MGKWRFGRASQTEECCSIIKTRRKTTTTTISTTTTSGVVATSGEAKSGSSVRVRLVGNTRRVRKGFNERRITLSSGLHRARERESLLFMASTNDIDQRFDGFLRSV